MATLVGGSGDDTLVGQGGSFTIDGMGGNDVEIGGNFDDIFDMDYGTITNGAAGIDIMQGGDGNDTYYVDNVLDEVVEQNGLVGGNDLVISKVDFTLFSNIEQLTLDPTGAAHVGIGNDLANTIIGNDLGDTLDGGLGADTLTGGTGNDTYIVDNLGDVIDEPDLPPASPTPDTEIDMVISSVAFDLSNNGNTGPNVSLLNIENLTLTGTAIFGRGNALDNILVGNAQDNTLDASDGGNDTLDGGAGADSMIGGIGEDTFFVDNVNDKIFANAGAINTVESTVTWTMGVNQDNLILLGTSAINGTTNGVGGSITGNSAANVLTGQGGDDILNGGGGADTMIGGNGNDFYFVDNSGDKVVENVGEGIDTVIANASYDLTTSGANVENLTLGGTANINGTGNALNNILVGNSGDNTLDGRGGVDTMVGGAGNDTFFVDNAGDFVNEIAGQGIDTVVVSQIASYTLTTNTENLILSTGALNGYGNSFNNAITGNASDNSIDGGAGADTMSGGAGNDTYMADNVGDVVSEGQNGGTDTVISSVSFTLGAFVENLTLTGGLDKVGVGNGLVNIIDASGSSGNDTLDGGGGADILIGNNANDTFVVHSGTETIFAGTGVNTIESSVISIDLNTPGFAGIHQATLTGSANLTLTGTNGNDILTGNDGNNIIDGGGGIDSLEGGLGNDTFHVDTTSDVITDTAGVDTIVSSVDYDLTTAPSIENLILTGAAVVGTGNNFDNVITGNSNANTVYGGSGNDTIDGRAGADTMYGGTGNDTFYVDNPNDVIVENASEGTDTVIVAAGVVFNAALNAANVEVVINLGASSGSLTGGSGSDVLTGNAGNNILNGGAGADTMIGGLGNDIYYVDNAGDTIVENPGAGIEKIFIAPDPANGFSFYDMETSAANTENATISGTSNFDLRGNVNDNILIGNSGDNVLNGWYGTDTLIGGAGNDTYVVNNIHDILVDATGTDTVISDVSWTLKSGFENLILMDATSPPTPTGDLIGTGNNGANIINAAGATGNHTLLGLGGNDTITGGSGNDTLNGGAGADTMQGGNGNDSYIVDNPNDVVIDGAGHGTDSLSVNVNYMLRSTDEIENISLTGGAGQHFTGDDSANLITANSTSKLINGAGGADTITGSTGNDSIAGGDGNDTLTGNGGNDKLDGGAGDDLIFAGGGQNVLTGGAGQDTFVFDMATAFQHAVTIKDFNPNDTGGLGGVTPLGDVLDLSDILSNVAGTVAGEPLSDFLNIRNSNGNSVVSIDLDGVGTAHHFQVIAVLQGITGLTGEEALALSGNINIGTFGS